jgi:soluble lytic murein transglycosylase
MPRIPSDSYFPTADVGAVQPFRVDTSALSPELAAAPGRQEQQVGQGLMNLGGEATRIATDFQDQINQSRVLDARNQLAQYKGVLSDDPKQGYLSRTGLDALKPEDGKSLADVYLDKFQKQQDEVMAGLDNDHQRLLLKPHAQDIALQIQQETQKHALGQFKNYQLSNLDGQIKLSVDEASRNWQDPTAVQKNLLQAMTAVVIAGTVQGKAPTEIEAQARIASSTVHLKVLDAALENNNPSYANLYFQMHKDPVYVNEEKQVVPKGAPGAVMMDGGMRADDILRFQGAMNKTLDSSIAQQSVAATVSKFTPQIVPSNMDRLTSIVSGMESNGKDVGADGAPVTSAKGAKYAMQVMPDTAKNPGFGIRPAADDSPAEYNRVGREYLGKLVEKYGNIAQAMAAYNAGPGAVDAAIKDKGTAWLGSMPKETQDYVAKGMQQFGAGQGAPQIPTEQAFVADALGRLGASPRPEQVQLTRTAAEHQYGLIVKSMKEQGDAAYNNVLRDVIAKGGDFNQVDAGLKMELTRLDPDKYDNAIKMAKIVSDQAAGKNVETNPTAMVTSISHPERLAAMRDGEFTAWMTSNFPRSEWASVAKRRDDAINGTVDTSAGGVNHKALDRIITLNQVGMGLDPAKGGSDPKLRQAVDNQKAYITQTVLDQQAQLGRKMTEDEIIKHVNKVYASDVNFHGGMGLFGMFSGSQPLMKINSVTDLPDGAADGIKKLLAEKGNKNPTDSQVVQFYWKMHK